MDDEDVDWPEMKYVEIAPTENGIQGSGASAETTEHGSLQEGQSSVYVKVCVYSMVNVGFYNSVSLVCRCYVLSMAECPSIHPSVTVNLLK